MACLCFIFLAFVLAYQCVGVANGAANEDSLPSYVKNKHDLFEKLKALCEKKYQTRVVGSVNLPGCVIYCARGVFMGLFGRSDVTLTSEEPCSDQHGVCVGGQCVYYQ